MAENNDQIKKKIQTWLFVVAFVSVASAVLHAFFPDRFDEKTAMFLAVAIAALVIQQITKFKIGSVELEKITDDVNKLKENFEGVEKSVGTLERSVGPGRKRSSLNSALIHSIDSPLATSFSKDNLPSKDDIPSKGRQKPKSISAINPDDPNKGRFGGKAEANGRKLSAEIEPERGPNSSYCRVKVRVESTDKNQPLRGKVKLFLHPTFGEWTSYELAAHGSAVEDEFVSYGAFTIGAETDNGNTHLELDLADVKGGTKRFYES